MDEAVFGAAMTEQDLAIIDDATVLIAENTLNQIVTGIIDLIPDDAKFFKEQQVLLGTGARATSLIRNVLQDRGENLVSENAWRVRCLIELSILTKKFSEDTNFIRYFHESLDADYSDLRQKYDVIYGQPDSSNDNGFQKVISPVEPKGIELSKPDFADMLKIVIYDPEFQIDRSEFERLAQLSRISSLSLLTFKTDKNKNFYNFLSVRGSLHYCNIVHHFADIYTELQSQHPD